MKDHTVEKDYVINKFSPLQVKSFMKDLRNTFIRNYPSGYSVGSIYSDESTITYFPFTPDELRELKLKIAIVFNHKYNRFEIWLAGQNKQIQKQYWEIFKESDWRKYSIPESIEKSFSIVETIIEKNPTPENTSEIKELMENQVMKFIKDISDVLL
jgi:AraC family transcriptional regulator